jgi:enamine deaminase RidA (YjgF/YER057c/UK114 family)
VRLLGPYAECLRTGNFLYLSGVLPVIGHEPKFVGWLGREYNAEGGREEHARGSECTLCGEKLSGFARQVTRVVKLTAYLATEENFLAHPKVADAASELLRDVFGEDKPPVRMILGVESLPLGVPVVGSSFRS